MNAAFSLHNISIKQKILGLAGILLFLMFGSTSYALYKMNQVGLEIQTVAEEDMPLIKIITEITVHQLEQAINFERALRYGEEVLVHGASDTELKKATSTFDALSEKINKEIKQGEHIADEAIQVAHTQADRDEFRHVKEQLVKIEQEHTAYEKHVHEIFSEIENNNIHHALELSKGVEKEEEKIDHELEALLTEIENFTAESTLKAEHDEQEAFKTLSIIALVSTVFGIFVAAIIVRTVSKGISRAVSITEVVASGDLSKDIQVDSGDEIGKLLNALKSMQDKLRAMILSMQQSATELAASSEELATVTEETSRNIANETTEIQQSATAIHQMAATIDEVAQNASATAEAAINANKEAVNGDQVVQGTITSIKKLAETIENSSSVIHQVGEDSQSIGTVLDVIKNIAEQTNLLALNAAIEAARAGEQGRGFAVVADEVRTLAQRTQQSTHEIEDMISKLQGGAQNAVSAMEAGQDQAQHCVAQASQAGDTLGIITGSISTMNDMNTHIASAAEEQTSVANEISQSITELSQITEHNSTAVTEMAATSEEVARMATHLQDLTAQFRIQ